MNRLADKVTVCCGCPISQEGTDCKCSCHCEHWEVDKGCCIDCGKVMAEDGSPEPDEDTLWPGRER